MMKKTGYILWSLLTLFIIAESCNIKGKKTTLKIVDNHRHYYPILRGQKKELIFHIKNTGKNPFLLTDIFTSSSNLKVSKKSSIKGIPVGREGILRLEYLAISNVGYAKYYVTLYGNFDSTDKKEIVFDTNIVPQAAYTKDYEEVYKEAKDKYGLKEAVKGDESQKGYYMDGDFKE